MSFRRNWLWLIVLPVAFLSCCFPWHTLFWIETSISLPDGTGQIVFRQKGAHPFLAEYWYQARLETKSHHGVTVGLPANAGGRTDIEVWWHPASEGIGPFVRLSDSWGECIVDTTEAKSYAILRRNGRVFGGEIAKDEVGANFSWHVTGVSKTYNAAGEVVHVDEGGEVFFRSEPAIDVGEWVIPEHAVRLGRIRGSTFIAD